MKNFGREFLQRMVVSTLAIVIVGSLLFYAYDSIVPLVVFFLIGTLGFISHYEFIQLVQKKAQINQWVTLPSVVLLIGSFFVTSYSQRFFSLPSILLFLIAMCIFLSHFSKIDGALVNIPVSFFSIVYVAVPLGMILSVLYDSPKVVHDGRLWVIYLLVVTKITDVAAYFVGKILGKHQLVKSISPNKTVEGSIGGFLIALLASFFFNYLFPSQFSKTDCLILGIILALFSQIGDLVESLFKRDAKMKDSSTIPGVGGILDMLDSIFINAPILYFYLS